MKALGRRLTLRWRRFVTLANHARDQLGQRHIVQRIAAGKIGHLPIQAITNAAAPLKDAARHFFLPNANGEQVSCGLHKSSVAREALWER